MAGLLDPRILSDPRALAGMDHATLYRMREAAGRDQALQDLLSGYEHRAFAREATRENPLMGLPIAVAAPLFQLAKLAPGLTGNRSRSQPSLGQLGQGLLGIGEGLLRRNFIMGGGGPGSGNED